MPTRYPLDGRSGRSASTRVRRALCELLEQRRLLVAPPVTIDDQSAIEPHWEQTAVIVVTENDNAIAPSSEPDYQEIANETNALIEAAKLWNQTSPPWSIENQCHGQAIGLMVHLRSLDPKHWWVDTVGGYNGSVFNRPNGYHHATLLKPKPTNPQPPLVLDAYKSERSTSTEVRVMSLLEFRARYPYECGCCRQPDTWGRTNWWVRLLNALSLGDTNDNTSLS